MLAGPIQTDSEPCKKQNRKGKISKFKCHYCHNESNESEGWYVQCNITNKNYKLCSKLCFELSIGTNSNDYEINNCSICLKNIATNVDAIFCDLCSFWVHRKCIKNLSHKEYETLSNSTSDWTCPPCQESIFPFYGLDDEEFLFCCNNYYYNMSPDVQSTCKRLMGLDFNIFHKKVDKSNSDTTNALEDIDPDYHLNFSDNCNYILEKEDNVFTSLNDNELSVIHINIRSIQQNFESLQRFLSDFQYKFDIIGLTETWLKDKFDIEDFKIDGYKAPHHQNRKCRTGGGVLFYVRNYIISKTVKKTYAILIHTIIFLPYPLLKTVNSFYQQYVIGHRPMIIQHSSQISRKLLMI